jgi:hypothetical protein
VTYGAKTIRFQAENENVIYLASKPLARFSSIICSIKYEDFSSVDMIVY